jgi:oxalyl-CoA decarboxylase
MAKGLLPDDHPQSVAAARSLALREADVVMLVGARLNWLLGHGEAPQWNPDAKFIQVDIEATEFDSNRGQIAAPPRWRDKLSAHSAQNVAKMSQRLSADPHPMQFYGALRAIRDVLHTCPQAYLVNEGANTLDFARNVVGMRVPRHRLDCGTWGIMGIGLGYAIAAAVETGQPVVAIEGDSAFGFSGMEMETICRYHLPITVVVFNNGGVYKGDGVNTASTDPSPTTLLQSTRYDHLIESFGGTGYLATTPADLTQALSAAITSGKPALIDCVIDPTDGTESGHLTNLNPVGIQKR